MSNEYPFINREISNVAFNQRVLYEAIDGSVTIVGKIKIPLHFFIKYG